MIQRRVRISGTVQGVGFRAATVQAAMQSGQLRGFVRNLSDGRVEAVICGDPGVVLSLVAWCSKGPFLAQVTQIEVVEETPDATLKEFAIQR